MDRATTPPAGRAGKAAPNHAGKPVPLFYVVDARGEPLKIAWTDDAGGYHEHALTPFQAACLVEDLGAGLRKRVQGGW